MTKRHSTLEQDLSDDYNDAENTRRLNQFDARLRKLEGTVQNIYEHGLVTLTLPGSKPRARVGDS